MKILFLTDNFPPEVNAPANRTFEHCQEWVKDGADVTVITCAPNFPKGKIYPGYKNKFYSKEEIEGIKVIRVWTYITANEGFVKRILDYLSFAFMSFCFCLFRKTDLIVATSPQFFTAVSGWMLGFFKRKKWVMEVRDLWPESIVAVGAMKNKTMLRFFEALEKRLYKSAYKIVVVTDSFKEKITEKGIDANKISVFKNGVLLDNYFPAPKNTDLLQKHNINDKFIFAYIGTHGMAHALDFILDSVKEIKDTYTEIVFIFMGDGAKKNDLKIKAKNNNLTNVLFLDSVSKKEVIDYLNLMDVALVNLKKSDTFKTVIPSKIFEAAAVQKPILLGLEGETKGIIQSYNAGLCFEPENKEEFINSVIRFYEDQNFYQLCQKGCSELAIDFDRKKIAIKMLDEITK
ncbi:MAG: glycosyltransferase family 4 protein [Flavobacteriia bacterium]|jgi:glycosyltransferase involved in cell wall biosynthesis